ncbi:MAG: transposase [Deltaproteobacteria bacterium]|nr:transposase [Deltaproteobacteria bacterium]
MARSGSSTSGRGATPRAIAPGQLALDRARRPTGHGGWRPGAGRPRGRTKVPHLTRPRFAARYPQHVTLRLVAGLGSLRRHHLVARIHASIAAAHRDDFRVVHFAILANHIHLVVETSDAMSLARRMQGLAIRIARTTNRALVRRGRLFAERYHARALRTPREVRNALAYVLHNARGHAAERNQRLSTRWIDPCSSGPWFADWRASPSHPPPWLVALRRRPDPTRPARTWLLTTGWRRHGAIALDERGPPAPRSSPVA